MADSTVASVNSGTEGKVEEDTVMVDSGAAIEATKPESTDTGSKTDTTQPTNIVPQRTVGSKLVVPEGMSKNQYKKLLKQQAWDAGKEARAELRKQKNKEAKLRKREELKEKRKREEEAGVDREAKKVKRVKEDVTILLDCAFDDKMIEKEINSLSSQITRCHSANRLATHRVSFKLTSYGGRLRERMDGTLRAQHKNWSNFVFTEEPYEVNDRTIYLTAESENTLEILDSGMTYIVGGLVDKNRYKGICHKKATEQGLKTAKLPIGEYIEMSSRHVLTTNHVVEIMLKWLELRDWKAAFLEVIPQRKMAHAKNSDAGSAEKNGAKQEDSDSDNAEEPEEKVVEKTVEENNDEKAPEKVDAVSEEVK